MRQREKDWHKHGKEREGKAEKNPSMACRAVTGENMRESSFGPHPCRKLIKLVFDTSGTCLTTLSPSSLLDKNVQCWLCGFPFSLFVCLSLSVPSPQVYQGSFKISLLVTSMWVIIFFHGFSYSLVESSLSHSSLKSCNMSESIGFLTCNGSHNA